VISASSKLTLKTSKSLFLIVVLAGLLSGVSAGAFLALTRDLPQVQSLENFRPSAVTRIYSADRVLLSELFVEKREPVPISQIPDALITALLAIEDRRFYEHSGLALKGIARATVRNIVSGRFAEGASTLTQQLAKTLFLSPRKTFTRKLREAILALQLERRYTKQEILGLYLNQIYLGSGAYGAAAAARIYFDKPVGELTLAECALLAGLPQAPSRYSPLLNPDLALKRRNIVLAEMNSTGAIDDAIFQQAIREPLHLSSGSRFKPSVAPFFIDHLKTTLEQAVGADLLYKGGLVISTTLSHGMQMAAETAVHQGLVSMHMRQQETQARAEAALVAVDVTTGAIICMVGGSDHTRNSYNRSVSARQPGSAFKPLIFALALERGFHQDQKLLDAPVVFEHSGSLHQDWRPHNYDNTYEGEISLRWALIHSKNIPAVRLIEKLGPSSVVTFAQSLGISSPLNPDLSLALGTSGTTLLELTAAYAVFANRGEYISPFGVAEITDPDGRILWQARPQKRVVMSRSGAAIMTDMLSAVITSGTGRAARASLRGALAGKTGTTNDFKDALFIGYSPAIAAGVWMGSDTHQSLGHQETGARAALPIWVAFMQSAQKYQTRLYFDIPDDVTPKYIDPRNGSATEAGEPGAVRILVKRASL
jgi:penicillin-binding protein 1A